MVEIIFAALLAMLVPNLSDAWTGCGSTSTSNTDSASLSPNGSRVLCHDTVANTATDSGILSVTQCNHIQIEFDPSYADASTGAEAQIYYCPYATASTTTCAKLLVDTDGDGIPDDVTLNGSTIGRIGQQWQNADWIFVHMTVAPSGGAIARTKVTCFP